MTKQDFGVLCDKYKVNKKAVKNSLKLINLKRKHASKQDVLIMILNDAPNVFWTRSVGDDEVEYLDKNIIVELIAEINAGREKEVSQFKEFVERVPVKEFVGNRVMFSAYDDAYMDRMDRKEYDVQPFSCDKGVSK